MYNILKHGQFLPRINYGINFLPAGHEYVVERMGKFSKVKKPGLALLIPFIDKISYVVDKRELCLRIDPEIATTMDNVMVKLGGNLFITFRDSEKAAYGASQPIYAASQFAQSVMRTEVGKISLDKLFGERGALNIGVETNMNKCITEWGAVVNRFEITDLEPVDRAVSKSLHKQSTAERDRRETVITAEAVQRKIQLEADAYQYQQIAEAKGDAEKVRLAAEAKAYEIEKEADAQKKSITMINDSLKQEGGDKVGTYLLSQRYIEQFGHLAKVGNTFVLPTNLADIASVIGAGSISFNKFKD